MEAVRTAIGPALRPRYVIERELATGAMGVVFLAHDTKHDRHVAIKVLRPELAGAISEDRFHREIELVASLAHPHIMPLHDSGSVSGMLYYVMPFMEGESLRAVLDREGRLPIPDAMRITNEIADALGFAHAHQVIHRDVKPGNIMLAGGHALLTDFGIARLARDTDTELTGTGISVGTPVYMSPEQVQGDRTIDARSDLYSLGCVLFEMVSGEPPFRGPSQQGVLISHLLHTPPDVRTLRPDAPSELQGILRTALQKAPEDRFQTAEEMVAALSAVRAGTDVGAGAKLRRKMAWRARTVRGWQRLALIALAVLLAVSVPLLLRKAFQAPEPAYAVEDPRGSYVALAFGRSGQTPEDERIAMAATDYLSFLLDGWETVDSALEHELMGDRLRLGLPAASLASLEDGLRLARAAGVGTLIGVRARLLGDTAVLDVRLYDVADGHALGASRQLRAPADGIQSHIETVAADILDLRDEDLDALKRESVNQDAWGKLWAGLTALYDWQLTEAERRFRQAVDLDPEFARAHHYLAVTLFWRMRGEPETLFDLAPAIQQLTGDAYRLAERADFNPKLEDHISGFHEFTTGNYEAARALYDTLIRRDSTDAEAWLFRGVVEWDDPWLQERNGSTAPRGDINLARAAFRESNRLWPEFQVSRGLAFEIGDRLTYLLLNPKCEDFAHPDDQKLVSPFEDTYELEGEFFFPQVVADSLIWIPCAEFDRASWEAGEYADMARALYGESLADIETWARFAPEQPRPLEEWATMLLRWRSRSACDADPAVVSELTREALAHTEAALAMRSDTTPAARIRLGLLLLAADRIDALQAADMVESGLREAETADEGMRRAFSRSAANAFLAAGRPGRSIDVLRPRWIPERRATHDPRDSARYEFGDVFEALREIRLLGAVGATGSRLDEAVAEVNRAWSGTEYSPRARTVFQWSAALGERAPGADIRPALALDTEMRHLWFAGWEEDLQESLTPEWKGLLALELGPDSAAAWLEPALERIRGMRRPYATDLFVAAILAQSIDEHETAAELFGQASACPRRVMEDDVGWGLSPLSRLYRARSLEQLGREAEAAAEYAAVARDWSEADEEIAELVEEARWGAERLEGAP